MTKFLCVFLLLISRLLPVCAQQMATRPAAINFEYSIAAHLNNGNSMQLDVYGKRTILFNLGVDSLIAVAMQNIRTVKDTLATGAYTRKIILQLYDTAAQETIVINTAPGAVHYLKVHQQMGFVKAGQDTVIINIYSEPPETVEPETFYQLKFNLNDLNDIALYNNPQFGKMMADIDPRNKNAWELQTDGRLLLRADTNFQLLKGYDPTERTSSLKYNVGINLQNYRSTIVPSFTAGLGWFTEKNYRQRQYWLLYETQVWFGHNNDKKRETYLNDFVSLGYKSVRLDKALTDHRFYFNRYMTLGYLIKRKGDLYDRHTMRIGIGQFYIGIGSLRIEPMLYFHDWMQDVVPSFRITQSF